MMRRDSLVALGNHFVSGQSSARGFLVVFELKFDATSKDTTNRRELANIPRSLWPLRKAHADSGRPLRYCLSNDSWPT